MSGHELEFKNPIKDAVSRINFASQSNNLLISSWDSNLRLYDVESSLHRLEAPCEAALLDCCYQTSSTTLSAGSDGIIRRSIAYGSIHQFVDQRILSSWYDLNLGRSDTIGNHDDITISVSYFDETWMTTVYAERAVMLSMSWISFNVGYNYWGSHKGGGKTP